MKPGSGAVGAQARNRRKTHRGLGRLRRAAARAASDSGSSGGGVLRMTQLRKCTVSALNVSVCGSGLAGSTPMPELLPGHSTGLSGRPAPGRLVSKPPAPPPCGVLRDVVAAHVVGQRDVFLRARAHPFRAELQPPDFRGAEMLDDFRAGLGGVAAVEDAARRQAARLVGIRHPPLRSFAAGLVELQHAVGLRPAEIERDAAARDDRPHAVVHLAFRFVLVEAEMQPAPQVVAGLRAAARNAALDASRQRIRGAGIVFVRVFEERRDIAPRGETDAEDVRVFRGVDHLIELGRIEAALEADLHRQLRQRQRRVERAAAAEFPVGARDRRFAGDHAFHRFVIARDERRLRTYPGSPADRAADSSARSAAARPGRSD